MIRAAGWAVFYLAAASVGAWAVHTRWQRTALPDPCVTEKQRTVLITCSCPTHGRCDCTCHPVTSRGKL